MSKITSKLQGYKNEIDGLRKKFVKVQDDYIERRSNDELLSEGDMSQQKKGIYKEKLMENEELAYRQHEKLEGAKRQALEMEGISNGIKRDLHGQTEQLRRIHGSLGDMNQEIDQSGTIMARILKRENRNKVIIGLFSIIAIIVFIVIIYLKLAPASTTVITQAPSSTDALVTPSNKNVIPGPSSSNLKDHN